MFFSVGVCTPDDENTAYGMIAPAFSAYDYGCFSGADEPEQIAPMIKEAILMVVEDLVLSGKVAVEDIKDEGYLAYSASPEYDDFDSWFMIEIDLSDFEGKPQLINISLPCSLIKRIDNVVISNPAYRDRSHFLAEAARRKLNN